MLAAEMVVERAFAQTSFLANLGHASAIITRLGEATFGRIQDADSGLFRSLFVFVHI
jgi:hypothetical protein